MRPKAINISLPVQPGSQSDVEHEVVVLSRSVMNGDQLQVAGYLESVE